MCCELCDRWQNITIDVVSDTWLDSVLSAGSRIQKSFSVSQKSLSRWGWGEWGQTDSAGGTGGVCWGRQRLCSGALTPLYWWPFKGAFIDHLQRAVNSSWGDFYIFEKWLLINRMKLNNNMFRIFLKGIIIKFQDTSIFPYGCPPHCSHGIQ